MVQWQALASFGALSQETRLQIVRMLVIAGPSGMPAGAIAEKLEVSPSNVSFHLKEIERAGLIDQKREIPLHHLFRQLRGAGWHGEIPDGRLLRWPLKNLRTSQRCRRLFPCGAGKYTMMQTLNPRAWWLPEQSVSAKGPPAISAP